jgi:hypothetical protein
MRYVRSNLTPLPLLVHCMSEFFNTFILFRFKRDKPPRSAVTFLIENYLLLFRVVHIKLHLDLHKDGLNEYTKKAFF